MRLIKKYLKMVPFLTLLNKKVLSGNHIKEDGIRSGLASNDPNKID